MNAALVLQECNKILLEAKIELDQLTTANFLDYADKVRDVMMEWPRKRQQSKKTLAFAEALRELRDKFDTEVARDPMMLYHPAHQVALDFHESDAFIRYFRGGNRISKTESARADNYMVTTGQLTYRAAPPLPSSVFIVGVNYKDYAPEVFEKKYIFGEPGNPLTPAFPIDGKWLNRYDERKKIIYIACPPCAVAGKAQQCAHSKSTIHLFSDQAPKGHEAIAGGQYAQGQFDEHVNQRYFSEAITRLETVPRSSLMVTGTPLQGKGAWEHQTLTLQFEKGGIENQVPGTERTHVSLHTIDQFSAGLVAPELIEAKMRLMPPAEIEARVWGRPAAFSETSVFDVWEISNMYEEVDSGTKGFLVIDDQDGMSQKDMLFAIAPETTFTFEPDPSSLLTVWEPPQPHHQYVLGADVAQGLRDGDASCLQVLKITPSERDFHFEQVAKYHGWISPETYADDIIKVASWYNDGLLVVERRGPGDRTLQRLKELVYWNLFQDSHDPASAVDTPDALYGIDTNVKSKGVMIATLQQLIKDRQTARRYITIRDFQTLEELGHYGQELTSTGLSYRFRGEGGYHDDCVMGLALATYAVKAYAVLFDYDQSRMAQQTTGTKKVVVSGGADREFWEGLHKELKDDERASNDPFFDG